MDAKSTSICLFLVLLLVQNPSSSAEDQNCFFTTDRVKTWCVNWACKFGCLIDAKQYHTKYKNSWCEGSRKGICYCQFCD
ncbi:hypothetical protein BDA96_02G099400 [Sorghum bicolor]|uniref:Knottin scorpion toxin-like domain-containing protein n=2 Tax=Sorghum bicolor TaxID=4558 RepID=A0A921RMG9_SORBI|nr:hypothetical protein BDA96_02G099400 [Sorghum bicolor]KXG34821.1 hypothetical protein SORBI_3002G096400 [Sorghum bicolor]